MSYAEAVRRLEFAVARNREIREAREAFEARIYKEVTYV